MKILPKNINRIMLKPKLKRDGKLYLWTVIHGSKKVEEVIVQSVTGEDVKILNKNFQIETHMTKGSYRSYFNTESEANTFIRNKCKQ